MLYGLMFTIGSLIFLMLLLFVYYSKRYFDSVSGSLYRIMLISCIMFMLFQIISVISLYFELSDLLTFIFWRISWSFNILWYCLFLYYFIALITKSKYTSTLEFIKSRKIYLITAICFVIMILCYIFVLPFAGLDSNNMSYIPGKTAILVYLFCIGINLAVIINLMNHIKELSKTDIVVVSASIVMTIILIIFQSIYVNISIIPIGFAIEMYLLYFSTENPDLQLIDNTRKISDELDRSNKVKIDFLSNISYEIKNPMETISGLTDTLLNTPYKEESARNYLKQICTSSADVLDITNNILNLSTLETGSNIIDNNTYSLSSIIEKLAIIIKNKLGFSKVKFNVSVDSNIPRLLYGDESKIYQTLLNVLINAVKYTDIGKINFTVTFTRENNETVKLLFTIMDTGIGIKDEDKPCLFNKFTRLDDAINKEIEGSGLGLTIAKQYIDLMNGKIWFESKYLAGSTFYIELEQKVLDPSPINIINLDMQTIQIDDFDYSNKRILVVDDNEFNIKVIKRLLERYNVQVDTINSGDECIKKIKSEEKYDLILMDDSLPVISGTETMKILKKLSEFKIPPVVVLTANTILGMKEEYIKEGFDDYVSKPISMDDLDNVIKKFLRN